MKTFEEVWKFTDKIPGSFTQRSAEKYFEYAMQVPPRGAVAEIGVDQGRSASLLMRAAQLRGFQVILVDSWESVLIDNMEKVKALLPVFPGITSFIVNMKSVDAAAALTVPLDMLHIDAHHFDDIPNGGPSADCEAWLPHLKPGGIACFHDYNSCFPDVNIAVDKYCAGWKDLGEWDGLAIRRKP